jgi:hypothetical protein
LTYPQQNVDGRDIWREDGASPLLPGHDASLLLGGTYAGKSARCKLLVKILQLILCDE